MLLIGEYFQWKLHADLLSTTSVIYIPSTHRCISPAPQTSFARAGQHCSLQSSTPEPKVKTRTWPMP
jgi:hypothetical protein